MNPSPQHTHTLHIHAHAAETLPPMHMELTANEVAQVVETEHLEAAQDLSQGGCQLEAVYTETIQPQNRILRKQ